MVDHARIEPAIERRELTAPTAGRVDALVAAAYADLSRARVQRLIADGHVRLDGPLLRKSAPVEPGATITVDVPVHDLTPAPVPFDITILYEDDDLLAIDKPAGLAVHGAPGDLGPSVAGWFATRHPGLAAAPDAERPGIVHRLDKDTTGVLVLAKTPAAQAALNHAFEQRETTKLYLAVCEGVPRESRAVIDAPIGRHPGDRTRMAVVKRGRASRTRYEVLASDGKRSLLLVHLETGRTHQARVHLAAIGAPVAGDSVYGRGLPGERQLLHAYQITVPHPSGGTLTVTSALPSDMLAPVSAIAPPEVASHYTMPVQPGRQSTTESSRST